MNKAEAVDFLVQRYGNDPGVEEAITALAARDAEATPPAAEREAPQMEAFLTDKQLRAAYAAFCGIDLPLINADRKPFAAWEPRFRAALAALAKPATGEQDSSSGGLASPARSRPKTVNGGRHRPRPVVY